MSIISGDYLFDLSIFKKELYEHFAAKQVTPTLVDKWKIKAIIQAGYLRDQAVQQLVDAMSLNGKKNFLGGQLATP